MNVNKEGVCVAASQAGWELEGFSLGKKLSHSKNYEFSSD